MSCDGAIQVLKAAADPTRFRLLHLLRTGEATVGELQTVLQQSQPRVSRHLRLLGDAGLVDHFRDGQWKYYRLDNSADNATRIAQLLALAGDDPAIERDRRQLDRLKRARENEALRRHTRTAWIGRGLNEHRPGEAELSETLAEVLIDQRFSTALLVGCGGPVMLSAITPFADDIVAIDESKSARLIARSRVHQSGISHVTVRNAAPATTGLVGGAFELVVLNEALDSVSQPRDVLAEAVRLLTNPGQLLIFDRVRPAATRLATNHGDQRLAENQLATWLSEMGCRLVSRHWFAGRVLDYTLLMATKNISG